MTTRRAAPGAMSGSAFPCLDGVRYRGCLGAACPLETCWTGGVTISYAHKQRDAARVSSALYLPGAPCHTCAELVEDEAPVSAPRATVRPGAARGTARDKARGESEPKARGESEPKARGESEPKARGESEPKARGESEAAGSAEPVLMRRINCARGLWEHPISLSAFLMKRIPMLDQDEPETCPGYTRRPDPHPAVAAHLQQRRERARLRRASLRVSGQEG